MIRIIARNDGFRRCGVAHSVNPTDWPDERFSADELDILLNEPMLMVEAVADPVAEIDAEDTDIEDALDEAVIETQDAVIDSAAAVVDNVADASATVDLPVKPRKK